MSASPSWPSGLARDRLAVRVMRCLSVSVLTTGLSLTVLGVATAALGLTAWVANVVATGLGTVVSYRLNRAWVWGRRDRSDPWREVLPFWALSFAGLALSTLAVAGADRWASAMQLGGAVRTGVVLLASVAGYAALWVAQFVVLERVLFGRRHADAATRPVAAAPVLVASAAGPGGPRWKENP
jgi:putative flippase GtrA